MTRAFRSLGQDEVPFRHSPDWSLTGHEKVVAKNGPFSLTFCQVVTLMFPHHSVVSGRLDDWVALSQEEERHHTGHSGHARQKLEPACRRGPHSRCDRALVRTVRLAGAYWSAPEQPRIGLQEQTRDTVSSSSLRTGSMILIPQDAGNVQS